MVSCYNLQKVGCLSHAGFAKVLWTADQAAQLHSPSKGIGAGVMNKVSSSVGRAKAMGSKVVPTFNKDRKAQVIDASDN